MRDVVVCEQEGDRITHDIIQRLNATFVTPFDREDIIALASSLDDIVDFIEEVADFLGLYRIEAPMDQAVRMARVLHQDSERRRMKEEGDSPGENAKRLRRIFGFVEEMGFGDDGAVVLPPMMRRRARIGANALIVGVGGAFEIWDAQAAFDQPDPDLHEIAAYHLEVQQAA